MNCFHLPCSQRSNSATNGFGPQHAIWSRSGTCLEKMWQTFLEWNGTRWRTHSTASTRPRSTRIAQDKDGAPSHTSTNENPEKFEILAFATLFVALRELRKNISVFSPATYRLHRQFILLLATQVCVSSKLQKHFQIFTPLFFFSMPVLAGLICAKYHILVPMWLDQLGAFLTAIYGTMNASQFSSSSPIAHTPMRISSLPG